MRRLANLRALYAQPVTKIQGVPVRLDSMISRYYALVAMGTPFRGEVVDFIATYCTTPMTTDFASRSALADEIASLSAWRGFDVRPVAQDLRRAKGSTWLRLIEEVEDFRARRELGI